MARTFVITIEHKDADADAAYSTEDLADALERGLPNLPDELVVAERPVK